MHVTLNLKSVKEPEMKGKEIKGRRRGRQAAFCARAEKVGEQLATEITFFWCGGHQKGLTNTQKGCGRGEAECVSVSWVPGGRGLSPRAEDGAQAQDRERRVTGRKSAAEAESTSNQRRGE